MKPDDDNAPERWRWITGWKHKYEISDRGAVRDWLWLGSRRRSIALEKTLLVNEEGYNVVLLGEYIDFDLRTKGEDKEYRVDWLVASAFIHRRSPKVGLIHLNGDRRDDRAGNLAYADPPRRGRKRRLPDLPVLTFQEVFADLSHRIAAMEAAADK